MHFFSLSRCVRTCTFAPLLSMVLLSAFVVSCNKNEVARKQSQIDSLQVRLEESARISAQKDSISAQVIEATKTINEVYTRLSMMSGKTLVTSDIEKPQGNIRQEMIGLIDSLGVKLTDRKQQISSLKNRISKMKSENTTLSEQLATLEKTVNDLNTIIINQEQTISVLRGEVNQLRSENVQLTEQKQQLTEQKQAVTKERDQLTTEKYTVYIAIGSKSEFEQKGMIEKRGKVLFFGGVWQPTGSFKKEDYRTIDYRQVQIFDVPKDFKVVTKHDASLLEIISTNGNTSTVKVKDPDTFWAVSKYLIIVED